MARFLSAVLKLSLLTCLFLPLSACNLPGQLPAKQDPGIQPQATDSEEEYGSAVLTIIRGFGEGSPTHVIVTSAVELGISLDPKSPRSGHVIGTGKGQADTLITGSGSSGTTHTISGVWPVDYEISGKIDLTPSICSLVLTVDEFIYLSEPITVHSSILGDIPYAGGEDIMTSITGVVLTSYQPVYSPPGTKDIFTLDDVRMPGWVKCVFAVPE